MRTRLIVGAVAVALAAPGAAYAGCAATVGLAPPPAGLQPGETWRAELLVKQHGVRPLRAASPTVSIVNDETGERRTFDARQTKTVGVYRADVVFPTAGSWRYEAFDGFVAKDGSWTCAQTHTFPAVAIGGEGSAAPPSPSAAQTAPAPVADDGGIGAPAVLLALAALAFALGGVALLARRRRPGAARHA